MADVSARVRFEPPGSATDWRDKGKAALLGVPRLALIRQEVSVSAFLDLGGELVQVVGRADGGADTRS